MIVAGIVLALTTLTTPVGAPIYQLTAPLTYNGVTVPAGFLTDLASIPPQFWDRATPDGIWSAAAIVHDWRYASHSTSRLAADLEFRNNLINAGVGPKGVRLMFGAVRLFGGAAWRAHMAWSPNA